MTQLLHSLLGQVGLPIPPGLEHKELQSLSCDSRRISTGTLFLGLPGTSVDGGRFWRQVLADGAAAAVISQAAALADPRVRGIRWWWCQIPPRCGRVS